GKETEVETTTPTGGDSEFDDFEGAILAGDDVVNIPSATDVPIEEIASLEGVNFGYEKIDQVYPTIKIKSTEEFVEDKDPFLEDYKDGDIENDSEIVEAQIIDRKLRGYDASAIAREIVMQYGVEQNEALEKVYSIEVSVNDSIANTFFGKRYHECTEAEKTELGLYGGNVE
ncbi:hypothetical protein LCGC14_1870040, partial [marine sediment metagenome]